ncbi:MAG: phenylalanine--tRNA ligase beta subunit-related protein [candidate division KSB1 bacterium]|nr:phenylalanine--tRNA ligase beta subunit-related protein [candidate division KSB1 bacterium]
MYEAIRIAPDLHEVIYLAGLEIHGIEIASENAALNRLIEEKLAELRAQYATPAEARPLLEATRKMYRAISVDPTRTRPSSEALLRRVLQGKGLYTISTLVDSFNLLSLRAGICVGLYDMDHVQPPVELRLGQKEEGYPGINKDFIHVAGRFCLIDRDGPFGNPSSDSARTRIRPNTHNVLATYFVPAQTPESTALALLKETRDLLAQFHLFERIQSFVIMRDETKAV